MMLVLWTLLFGAQPAITPAIAPSDRPADRVEIVLYSDFQCPFCARFAEPLRDVHKNGVDGVAVDVVFKHFPLPIHPRAPFAHQAAVAAGEQGKFWEMHDLLFKNLARVDQADIEGHAKTLGLDMERFAKDLVSERTLKIIDADVAEGQRLRISGTPTFYVNGRAYSGAMPLPQLKQLVLGEQRRVRALAEVPDTMLSRGPATAPVTLELFVDLQSPVSRPAMSAVEDVLKRYPSDVRLQFRNFPLSFHTQAGLAHEAAMTAARDGRFWEFVSYLLDHQRSLREQDLVALAGKLGLDQTKFLATLQERRYAARVEADVAAGTRKGVRGSPAILVNGRRIDGVPSLAALTELIDTALREKPKP
jgi:protein-disulfide isomerase